MQAALAVRPMETAPDTTDQSLDQTMTATTLFAKDYFEARSKFRLAATEAGAALFQYRHPHAKGPHGEELFIDVAVCGSGDTTLLAVAGTHGVEGYAGSAVLTGWLREGTPNVPGLRQVFVHALNPYGFAWDRRVTEDNVDLNRNFIDHSAPYPENPGYNELREAICPALWTEASVAATRRRLDAYAAAHGPMALQQAMSGGQYADPLGIFFGGHAPTWSSRALRGIFAGLGTHARDIAVIDYHTGLGPWGYGEVIAPVSGNDDSFRRAAAWIGANEVTSPDLGTSTSAPLVGVNINGMREAARGARVTMVALEYGVKPLIDTLDALRADNWLHARGGFDSPQWRAIKQQIRDAFYGDAPDWKRMIVDRAFDVTRRVMAGLAKA